MINDMLARVRADPAMRGAADPAAFVTRGDVLLIGGYSRHVNGLILRALQYDPARETWKFTRGRARTTVGGGKIFRVYGDRASAGRYDYLLREELRVRGKIGNAQPFDLEPLEVLWRFLQRPETLARPLPLDRRPPTVGGAPQIVHLHPGGRATPFAVRWESAGQTHDYLLGRRVMPYENLDVPLVELDLDDGRLRVRGRGQWAPVLAANGEVAAPRQP